MNFLIDTQILIWFNLGSDRLKNEIYEIITDLSNQIYVSNISLMEIAVKQSTGKLTDLNWTTQAIVEQLQKDNISLLGISEKHIASYRNIPFYAAHKDPFDRFLLATALSENMPIISSDSNFGLYSPTIALIKA